MKKEKHLIERQAHLVGDSKYAFTKNKDADYPFIVKCIVKTAKICENGPKYVVREIEADNGIENFSQMTNNDLFNDHKTPMQIIRDRIEIEYNQRIKDYEKRMQELMIK